MFLIKGMQKIGDLVSKLERFLLSIILITMLGLAALQVILRNLFDSGIEWADVFTRHLVLWIGFFGATLATRERKHIRIDVLSKILPPLVNKVLQVVVTIFCFLVTALLCQAAYVFTMDERMAGTVLFEGIPTWIFISIMPIGFFLIAVRHGAQLIEELYYLATGQENPNKPEII